MMLSQIANAIDDKGCEIWQSWNLNEEQCLELARAVILAMREPGIEVRRLTTFEFAEVEWPALMDAILEGKPPLSEAEQAGMKPEGRNEAQNTFNNGDTWPPVGWKEIT